MSTPIDSNTSVAQTFIKLERQLSMAELYLADEMSERAKSHRWGAVKMAVHFLKSAVDAKVISMDLLIEAIEKDRCL